jgi:tripartite-type tricarboxylate transporter receptor subunit TctC
MMSVGRALAGAALAGTCTAMTTAYPQQPPSRPIRLIVPSAPGGSYDIIGRIIAQSLTERMGRPVVVDNRAGSNSIIGTEIAANSPADGSTLVLLSTSFTTNPIIHQLPYDSLKGFAWVAMLGVGPNVLAVPIGLPARSVKELIAMAKAKPGQLVYASTGVGSNAHFGTELFKHMTGVDLLHVSYKGGGPALLAAAGGQAHMFLSSLVQALPLVRAGKLRALATSGEKRSVVLPEVPTIAESGVPGYSTENWWGIAAPRGTSRAIVHGLNNEINAVLANPEVEKRLVNEGVEPSPRNPKELGQHVATEMAKWVTVAKAAGIKGR